MCECKNSSCHSSGHSSGYSCHNKCSGYVADCKVCKNKTYDFSECKCNIENALITKFVRHSWYTILVINTFLLSSPNADAMGKFLLDTATDISRVVQKYTTICIYDRMVAALTHHIEDAGAALVLLKSGSPELPAAIEKLYKQTDELATVFSALNPCVLTYECQKKMWVEHVDYIVEIATLVNDKKYYKANASNNGYSDQMIEMAIMIADGLAQGYCCKCKC